jgi:hypothetical protein
MTTKFKGWTQWRGSRDEGGHRTYTLKTYITSNSSGDGPVRVFHTPGLPVPGSVWALGNDLDAYAWCRPNMELDPVVTEEPNFNWVVTNTFSTKPPNREEQKYNPQFCYDQEIQDPLLVPPQISGGAQKFQREAVLDMNGKMIRNSAWELVRGPQNEWDESRPTITIQQNFADFTFIKAAYAFVDCVNQDTMWGLDPRCIKLSNVSWERKFWGQCLKYFTRTLSFDIKYDTFDRTLMDEGTKVIKGYWDKDPTSRTYGQYIKLASDLKNPSNFIRFKDFNGENAKVILDGQGYPLGGDGMSPGKPGQIFVQKYVGVDLLSLGVPSSF